jgi:hypothetical protein
VTYLIQSAEGDPIPTYYSRKVGRDIGATHGWTPREREATAFQSVEEAENFIGRQLTHVRVNVVEKKL